MAMEIGFRKFNKIIEAINSIPSFEINSEKKQVPINDRLTWAIKRFNDKNESIMRKMQDGAIDLQREYASLDEKNNFIVNKVGNNESLSFTAENQKKLTISHEKYIDDSRCDIEPYVCKDTDRSKTLALWIQVELDGIIITIDPEIKKFMDEENQINPQ